MELNQVSEFDGYHEWLGIPKNEQPATLYRLLGISDREQNAKVIENFYEQKMVFLRSKQVGANVDWSQRLQNELTAAFRILIDPNTRLTYDASLTSNLASNEISSQSTASNSLEPVNFFPPISENHAAVTPKSQNAHRKRTSQTLEVSKIIAGGVGGVILAIFALNLFGIKIFGTSKVSGDVNRVAKVSISENRSLAARDAEIPSQHPVTNLPPSPTQDVTRSTPPTIPTPLPTQNIGNVPATSNSPSNAGAESDNSTVGDARKRFTCSAGNYESISSGRWLASLYDNQTLLNELNRNAQYIELKQLGGAMRVRIYADRVDMASPPYTTYTTWHLGGWNKSDAPATNPQPPSVNSLTPASPADSTSSSSAEIWGRELLLNPGCDDPLVAGAIKGWRSDRLSWSTEAKEGPPPQNGMGFFVPPPVESAELYQDVSVAEFAERIDSQKIEFLLKGYVRSVKERSPDSARIIVEYRDKTKQYILISNDSGNITDLDEWRLVSFQRLPPIGTRMIRVKLVSTRATGEANDGVYDSLSLRASLLQEKKSAITATTPANDQKAPQINRTRWRYPEGTFERQQDGLWTQDSGGLTHSYREKSQNEEFIEMLNINGNASVRLYADRCELAKPADAPFEKRLDGRWDEPSSVAPPPAKETVVSSATRTASPIQEFKSTDFYSAQRKLQPIISSRDKQLEDARKSMLQKFETAIAAIRKDKRLASGDQLKFINRLQTERKAFDKSGYLPFSIPGLALWQEYVQQVAQADNRLYEAFEVHIKSALKDSRIADAENLKKELNRISPPRVIGRWSDWTMYSNKTMTNVHTWSGTWTMNKNIITVTWKTHQGDTFIDTATISQFGDTASVRNQYGAHFGRDWIAP